MTIHGFGLGASVVGGKQSRWWRYKVMINFPRILGRAQVCHQVRLPRHHRHLWPRVRPLDLRVCFRRLRGWVCASQNGVIKMVSSVLLSSRHCRFYLTTHSIMFQVRLSAEFCMTPFPSAGPSSSSSSESSSPSSGSSGWQSYYSSIHFPHLLYVMKTLSSSTLQSCGLPRLWDLPHGQAGVWEVNINFMAPAFGSKSHFTEGGVFISAHLFCNLIWS